MKKILMRLIFLLALGVFCFSAYQLFNIYKTYKIGNDLYNETADKVETPADPDDDSEDDGIIDPPIEIDFDELLAQNKDTVGWIYCEDTVIDYPVVKKDNSFYLHHMFNGKKNANGTIFVEELNHDIFLDENTVVYGHHMKNGSMFASLDKYKKEEGYYDKHKVWWFLTPETNYQIQVFAAYTAKALDDTYTLSFIEKGSFAEWLEKVKKKSDIETDVEVTENDHVVTLSTCAYNFKNARYVVIGKLVDCGKRDKKDTSKTDTEEDTKDDTESTEEDED